MELTFRPYATEDRDSCLKIFEANSPENFAVNERQDYERFLETKGHHYEVCEVKGHVCGAFGVFAEEENVYRLRWILLDPKWQMSGIGSGIMKRVLKFVQTNDGRAIRIAASQKSAPFFARFGATIVSTTNDGWGAGMHRIDMEWVNESNTLSEF